MLTTSFDCRLMAFQTVPYVPSPSCLTTLYLHAHTRGVAHEAGVCVRASVTHSLNLCMMLFAPTTPCRRTLSRVRASMHTCSWQLSPPRAALVQLTDTSSTMRLRASGKFALRCSHSKHRSLPACCLHVCVRAASSSSPCQSVLESEGMRAHEFSCVGPQTS